MLIDQQARELACDPNISYIVQAPAGSGKTELLTQRYLRLLSTVNAPEQIIALTFTRKAAAEMRERIVNALTRADEHNTAISLHQQRTHQFAAQALAMDKHYNWQILKHPQRLKIITIDALCQSLAEALPFSEKFAPFAKISEKAYQLYEQAACDTVDYLITNEEWHQDFSDLMLHLDNRQDKLIELLVNLLPIRDQWLSIIYESQEQSKEQLEYAFAVIEKHSVQALLAATPIFLQDNLCNLCAELAQVENNPKGERFVLSNWQNCQAITRQQATALANLLLTKDGILRKSFDHHVGLKKGICTDAIYKKLKDSSKELLAALSENESFINRLNRIRELPIATYPVEQWRILGVLLHILPLLAAHLTMVFKEKNQVDFVAVAQQALHALGDDDNPTDLTLHLDNAIHHLLIDEFQDTSIAQFSLVAKLVAGWQPNDGRSLFIVGDPMQSIYRFRQAEVGLFLKAKQQGIGPVILQFLELKTNFRSSEFLVNWVNHQFQTIFPASDSIEAGAVSFHRSQAFKTEATVDAIVARAFASKELEADYIVETVSQQLAINPEENIAILVRSRSHLSHIIPKLRAKNIAFQGVEIEKLSTLSHLKDVWSLVQALVRPADRIAWLSFLRSPWVGLKLEDLLALASFAPKKSIYFALHALPEIKDLSPDGFTRLQFIYNVVKNAYQKRQDENFTLWVIAILNKLPTHAILSFQQQQDLEQFWSLLAEFTANGAILDSKQFAEQFEKMYSAESTPSRLQIMTIHKSKGLEFDSVILPGLGAKTQKNATTLLRWLNFSSQSENLLLISPLRSAFQTNCNWYDFIGRLQLEKEVFEQQRLLYVAVTRARKRLFLTDCQQKISPKSNRALIQQDFLIDENCEVTAENLAYKKILLARLPLSFYENSPLISPMSLNTILIDDTHYKERQYGILAHQLLQWIANNHPSSWKDLPWANFELRFKKLDLDQLLFIKLQNEIAAMFNSEIGQWLWQQHHNDETELAFLVSINGQLQTRIIDRTFKDKQTRWVIDYKTGSEDELSAMTHQQQLNAYAGLFDEENIACGIYYLRSGKWDSWQFEKNWEVDSVVA